MSIDLKIALTAFIVLTISKVSADILQRSETKIGDIFFVIFVTLFCISGLIEVAAFLHFIWG